MITWVYGLGWVVLIAGCPFGSWWWRRRYRDEPFDSERIERRARRVRRFLFEGRSRVVGEVLMTALIFALSLAGAWALSTHELSDDRSNQMVHGGHVPGWLAYPVAILVGTVMSAWFVIDTEQHESRRRRAAMRPPVAPVARERTRVITEPDRSRTVDGTRWPPLPPR